MLLLLDTTTPLARLTLIEGETRHEFEWQADRELARRLLAWLQESLTEASSSWQDISGIGVLCGPGSFTGIRIGLTVLNTLADSLAVPIVGATGDVWQDDALRRLAAGESDSLVLPYYDREANITLPRK